MQDLERQTRRLEIVLDRRTLIKGMLGAGGALVAGAALDHGTDAAKRGYSGPSALAPRTAAGAIITITGSGSYNVGSDGPPRQVSILNQFFTTLIFDVRSMTGGESWQTTLSPNNLDRHMFGENGLYECVVSQNPGSPIMMFTFFL